jgi:hypothetical protein
LLVKRVMTGGVVGVTISDRFEWSLISSSVFLGWFCSWVCCGWHYFIDGK